MAKYFTMGELTKSAAADKLKIDNTPKDVNVQLNLLYTMDRLDEIRQAYGKPIYITSGYRCDALNKAVGGVKDSYHRLGLAVDIKWDEGLLQFLKEHRDYDKCIIEKSKTAKWIHLQFKNNRALERRQFFSLNA